MGSDIDVVVVARASSSRRHRGDARGEERAPSLPYLVMMTMETPSDDERRGGGDETICL